MSKRSSAQRLANLFPTDFYPLQHSIHPQSSSWYHYLLLSCVPVALLAVTIGSALYFSGQTTSTTVLGLYDVEARSSTELIRPSFFYQNDSSTIDIFAGSLVTRWQMSYSPPSFLNSSHCLSQPFRFVNSSGTGSAQTDLSTVISFVARFLPASLSIAAYHFLDNTPKLAEFTLSQTTTSLLDLEIFVTIDMPYWTLLETRCGWDWGKWCAVLNDTLPDPTVENKLSNASLWTGSSQFGPPTLNVMCTQAHVFFPGSRELELLSARVVPGYNVTHTDNALMCLTLLGLEVFGGNPSTHVLPLINYTDVCLTHFAAQNQQQPRFLNFYRTNPSFAQIIAQVIPVVGLTYSILRVLFARLYVLSIPGRRLFGRVSSDGATDEDASSPSRSPWTEPDMGRPLLPPGTQEPGST